MHDNMDHIIASFNFTIEKYLSFFKAMLSADQKFL